MTLVSGHPYKFDELAAKRILSAVHRGSSLEGAASMAGISKPTLWTWCRNGCRDLNNGEATDLAAFYAEVERTLSEFESTMVGVVIGACGTDWRAAAWLLERKWPKRWGRSAAEREDFDAQCYLDMLARETAALTGLDEGELRAEAQRLLDERTGRAG